jgi:hypothetical protein
MPDNRDELALGDLLVDVAQDFRGPAGAREADTDL